MPAGPSSGGRREGGCHRGGRGSRGGEGVPAGKGIEGMEEALFYLLLAIVLGLLVFAFYLFVRILLIYRRAGKLKTMRLYETILYAALRKMEPEEVMHTLLPKPRKRPLEEVLLRMGDEGAEGWKEKVAELYSKEGFSARRIRQLRSPLASRRADAARKLGRVADPTAVSALEVLLDDRKEEVREAALFALGRIGSRESLESLMKALERGDRWSQEKIAEAVEDAGDASRRLLVEMLGDPDPGRRAFAAEVLGSVGGPQEGEKLREALRDGDVDVRVKAAASLGRLKHRAARGDLVRALRDEAWEVRAQAAKSLGKIGEGRDAPFLRKALCDQEWWVRRNAASALEEMGEEGERALVDALWEEDGFARETAALTLQEMGVVERTVARLARGGDPEGERVLRRMAEIGCVTTLRQVMEELEDVETKRRLEDLLSGLDSPVSREEPGREGSAAGG